VEAQIQARVAEELKKLQQKESDALKTAYDKIAETSQSKSGEEDQASKTTNSVNKQVEDLRKKLEERKQVRALPNNVESARGEVVRCLTENDRRPLDCWQEVENFRTEVKKLEQGWVNKVTS
jgi:altered-inheritance-of-mitochondria protein 13